MKLVTCILVAFLPAMLLAETMECPDRPVMENFDFSQFQGEWFTMRRTGVPDDSKCQKQVFTSINDTASTITFSYADLDADRYTLVTHEGTIWKTDTPGKLQFNVPSIFPGRESAYWILNTDYNNWAVVYTCWVFRNNNHRNYVTVLSRSTSLSEDAKELVNTVLELNNYVADQMIRVSHYSCPTE